MLIRHSPEIPSSEITDPLVYAGRRDFVRTLAVRLGAASLGLVHGAETGEGRGSQFENLLASRFSTGDDKLTPNKSMTTYGNFGEFGPDKHGFTEKFLT